MAEIERTIDFISCTNKKAKPTQVIDKDSDLHTWYITEDEYFRLSKLFKRDFQETRLGGTKVHNVPTPCEGCGKYMEFIDWAWTAVQRGVHSTEFMFNALKHGRQGDEVMHDVYCSECGLLRAHSRDNAEGGAPNIHVANRIKRSDFPVKFKKEETNKAKRDLNKPVWGKWWLDDNGSAAEFLEERKRQREAEARLPPPEGCAIMH